MSAPYHFVFSDDDLKLVVCTCAIGKTHSYDTAVNWFLKDIEFSE